MPTKLNKFRRVRRTSQKKPNSVYNPELPFGLVQSNSDKSGLSLNGVVKLRTSYKRHGYLYLQLKRSKNVALFQQIDPSNANITVGYEVFLVKSVKERQWKGKTYPAHEKFPANSDFGVTAWVCYSLDRTLSRWSSTNS